MRCYWGEFLSWWFVGIHGYDTSSGNWTYDPAAELLFLFDLAFFWIELASVVWITPSLPHSLDSVFVPTYLFLWYQNGEWSIYG
ncbi:uncharacterized protein BJX67DRAFT_282555 [Aspergillus lucknowensis]|uniref:Uncharacterized protein n=1 Tax=Aspergillus lucknowensis TaxID=176173 RepID=A0ABR4M0W7_9EURO